LKTYCQCRLVLTKFAGILRIFGTPSTLNLRRIVRLGTASRHHLDDAHQSLILVIHGMAVIDKFADDHWIGERDDHFQ
jgi:hypothetical protein